MTATSYGWLILAFPIVGMLVVSLGWRVLPGRSPGWIASGAILGSFLSALGALEDLLDKPAEARSLANPELVDSAWTYVDTAGFKVDMAILIDPLSVFMCLVVSGVSFLIHVYSVAYMTSDRGYARYFAYLNFFVFSMLLLVLAANYVLLIVGWAFVGAASYLLISFWYRRDTATYAGIKAFVINVIGDVGLVVGAFLLFNETGALDYAGVFESVDEVFRPNEGSLVAACLLILVGAFAKSAQLPLHTWLPDAMEGPTPVSALIHAATMVTAGVYLIARNYQLFELAPTAADISAIIGCATLLFAATVALTVTDLKRVIAYSTISQIGYMVMGVSIAAYSAGLFHLMTHAFFKALLFMGAGSIIGAMAGAQSLDRMGGFRKAMPFTFVTFTIGALALAGVPPMSGFFSKDEILAFAFNRGGGYVVLAVVGYIAAGLTAFYAFRMVFRVFFREPVPEARELEHGHIAHGEPENPMTGEPEDTEVGFPGPGAPHRRALVADEVRHGHPRCRWRWRAAWSASPRPATRSRCSSSPPSRTRTSRMTTRAQARSSAVSAPAAMIGILGIALAYFIYIRRRPLRLLIRERFDAVHTFLVNKWYFDELFDVAVRAARAPRSGGSAATSSRPSSCRA